MSGQTRQAQPTRAQTYKANRPQSRNTVRAGRSTQGEYRYTPSGQKPPSRNMTVVRQVRALTPQEDRRIAKVEKKRALEARAEKEWQKDIVRTKGGMDVFMLAIILVLLALGTVAVFSSSYPYAINKGLDSNYFIKHQVIFLAIGAVGMAVAAVIPIRFYKNVVPIPAYIVSAILLVAVLFIGASEGEATRWIRIGDSFGIQPSELMKVSMALTLAWYAEKYEDKMQVNEFTWENYRWNTLYPLLILGSGCVLVLVGKHLSGTIIVAGIGGLLLIVAGCRKKWIFATAIPAGVVMIGAFLALNPYALERVTTKIGSETADKLDELYQTTQSIYAIGNGGAFGVGLGESIQKHSYLGAAHTDFIFSVWCEEWGFVGAVLLILLFLLFMWRGYIIATRAPDKFSMLTAFGITTHVGIQALLNMCVASDIIFNTGVSLPFFSYGGSSLIVLMVEMGVLLAISRRSFKKKSEIEREKLLRRAGMAE